MHPFVHAQATPDKPALICAGSGEVVSYKTLDDRSNRWRSCSVASACATATTSR